MERSYFSKYPYFGHKLLSDNRDYQTIGSGRAQNTVVEAARVRRYTRAEFTSIRFRLNGISLEAIQARFYQDEDLAERRIASLADMGQWLKALQAMLVERALKTNPLLAQHLAHATKTNRWAPGLVNFLVAAGEEKADQAATE